MSAVLCCACLALSSCAAPEPVAAGPEVIPDLTLPSSAVELPKPPPEPEESESGPESEPPEPDEYLPEPGMSAEETVRTYFEWQYTAYLNLDDDADCTAIVDMSKKINVKMLQWINMLNQRRRLLAESGLCYVDTEERSYEIIFDEQPDDDRLERWKEWMDLTGYTAVHFHIDGENAGAYPPFMAVNSQHTMFLQEDGDSWKITQHYFPGALRKYLRTGDIEQLADNEMLDRLVEEFETGDTPDEKPAPGGATQYDAKAAVAYAKRYTTRKNPDFYDIGDWMGNCANFVSQCLWTGLGESYMDSLWRGGDSGTPAWENVQHFWGYITGGTGLRGTVLTSAGSLRAGDIVQLRSLSDPDTERFTHSMLVVDGEKLMLAQNTPSSFVYYSDLVNAELRYVRPTYAVNGK